MKGIYVLVFAVVVTVHESLVRSQPQSYPGIPRTSTRKGSRQRADPSLSGFSFSANNGASNTRTKTKKGNRPSWNMGTWTNDMSRQRIPKPPPQKSISMQQWGSPFSYRSASDDMYLNPAKHPPVLMRDSNQSGRSVPKSRPLKSKTVKKATTPAQAEVSPPVEEPLFPLQEAPAYVVSESNLEQTTLAPTKPSSAAPSPPKTDYPRKEQKNSESSVPLEVISRVQQSSSSAEFLPASEPSNQPNPMHTSSAFARDKPPGSQNQQPKSTQINSVPRPPRPPRPLSDTLHTDKRMSSSKQMTYRVFSSWLDAPGMQDSIGSKAKGKHNGDVNTVRPEKKGAISASEVTFNHNKKMLSKGLFNKSQEKKTSFALAAAEGLTGEMNHRPNFKAFPNKPELRYSNNVNLGNVKKSSGDQITYNNDIALSTPVTVTEKLQRPQEVISMKSLTQINSGNQKLVRQSHDFPSINRSKSSRHKITTSQRTKVTPRENVGMSSYHYPSTSDTNTNQVYRAERRYAGNKHNPTNISTRSEEMLRSVASETASVSNIQEPADISARSKGNPEFSAHETSSLTVSKERQGKIEPNRVPSLNKFSFQGLENVNPSNIKNDILQKNLQNKKDFVLENFRATAGDNSKTLTTVFKTQPRTAEGSQKKTYLEPERKVIESPRSSIPGHIDIKVSGRDLIRSYNKDDGQSKQSLVHFSPTKHSYSKTEIVTLKQQGGSSSISTGKQDIQSKTTRQGKQARLIEDVNQHKQSSSNWQYNPDGISSAQVNAGFQNDFVRQEKLENTKTAVNKGHKNSYVLPDKQENFSNRADASLSKRITYGKSGDSRNVLEAESQTSGRSEAVLLKDYSAGPLKKPCDVAPVCGSDGFTYMSECFMWSGVMKTCDGFCPCKNKSPPPSKSQGTSTQNRQKPSKPQNGNNVSPQNMQAPLLPDWQGESPTNKQDQNAPNKQDQPDRQGRLDMPKPLPQKTQDLPRPDSQGSQSPLRRGPPTTNWLDSPPPNRQVPSQSGRQGPPPRERQVPPRSSGQDLPPLNRQGLPPPSGRQGLPPLNSQGPLATSRLTQPSYVRQSQLPVRNLNGQEPLNVPLHGQMSTERHVPDILPSCNCPNLRRPVCSVNGNTYENDCFRICRNEEKDCHGECPCRINKQRYDPQPNQHYDKPAPFDSQQGQYNSKYVTQDTYAKHRTNPNNFNLESQANQYGPNQNTEPQTNQYGPNPNTEPQTNQYGPNQNTEPQTNQYGPNQNTEPQTNQYGPNQNTEPQTNQYGPDPNTFNTEPQTNQYRPDPNTEPQTNQYGPDPNTFNTEPKTNQYRPNPNTEPQTNQYGPNSFTEPQTNQYGPDQNTFNTEPQTNQYGQYPNTEPQTNQYGPNLNTEPQTNQYRPNSNTEPQTNQYGPNPNTEPQTNQYGPNPNTEQLTNQYGPNPNTEQLTNQFGPNPNTEQLTNQYGPNPNNFNAEPQIIQFGLNSNTVYTESHINHHGRNNFNTEPPTIPNNYFTEPPTMPQTNQYGTNPNNFNIEPQTNQYGTNPNNFNAEPSNQPLSTCECGPGDIDPVCSTTGETIWYGCKAICRGVTIACSSECPC